MTAFVHEFLPHMSLQGFISRTDTFTTLWWSQNSRTQVSFISSQSEKRLGRFDKSKWFNLIRNDSSCWLCDKLILVLLHSRSDSSLKFHPKQTHFFQKRWTIVTYLSNCMLIGLFDHLNVWRLRRVLVDFSNVSWEFWVPFRFIWRTNLQTSELLSHLAANLFLLASLICCPKCFMRYTRKSCQWNTEIYFSSIVHYDFGNSWQGSITCFTKLLPCNALSQLIIEAPYNCFIPFRIRRW